MTLTTDHFSLDTPPGWDVSHGDGRTAVLTGPNGQRIMLTSFSISGQGTATELAAIRERIRANALEAMQSAAQGCGLPIIRPLSHNRLAGGLDIDEIACQSRERAFLQCAISSPDAVLLLTFEAPVTEGKPASGYAQIVNSVRLTDRQ